MLEHGDLRPREPRAVDDRRVVEPVADDHVLLAQDGRHRAGVRGEPGLEHERGVRVLERREAALELAVHLHLAGDRAHRAAPGAEARRGLGGGAVHPGVVREPEVVVRSEVDDLVPVEDRARAGRPAQRARMQQQAVGLERGELVLQVSRARPSRRRLPATGSPCRTDPTRWSRTLLRTARGGTGA